VRRVVLDEPQEMFYRIVSTAVINVSQVPTLRINIETDDGTTSIELPVPPPAFPNEVVAERARRVPFFLADAIDAWTKRQSP
jgi:hypothetical protein